LRRRASIAHAFSNDRHAVIPFDAVEDVTSRHGAERVYLVHDQDRLIERLFEHFAGLGMWPPVIAYAEEPSLPRVVQAVSMGAVDYLAHPFDAADLEQALANAEVRGASLGQRHERAIRARANLSRLSMRERQVVSSIADGLTNKHIGQRLQISPRTVEIHRTNALAKLGVGNSYEAVRMVIEAEGVDGQ
jgi:FixJ family two-component response regulator